MKVILYTKGSNHLKHKNHSQDAVSFVVDAKTMTVLSKIAPDMSMHTKTCPSDSITVYVACTNPTCTTVINTHSCKMYILGQVVSYLT